MSNAGWYADPGGQPGMYRYWNGTTWSAAITSDPNQAPPATGLGQQYGGGQGYGQQTYGQTTGQPYAWNATPAPPEKKSKGPLITMAVIAVVVAVALYFVITNLGRVLGGGGTNNPGGSNPTTAVCPKSTVVSTANAGSASDGRVHGGKLSYPMLGSPWSYPADEYRVPFGRNAKVQTIMVEDNYDGMGSSWVASVLVAELIAGDGFFSPQQGSEIVAKCIVGTFYGDAAVNRADSINKATTVDGKDAWLLETHLTFSIKGLKTTGELAIILIVATSAESSSIYYASIPDTVPQYVQPARDAMAALTVDK